MAATSPRPCAPAAYAGRSRLLCGGAPTTAHGHPIMTTQTRASPHPRPTLAVGRSGKRGWAPSTPPLYHHGYVSRLPRCRPRPQSSARAALGCCGGDALSGASCAQINRRNRRNRPYGHRTQPGVGWPCMHPQPTVTESGARNDAATATRPHRPAGGQAGRQRADEVTKTVRRESERWSPVRREVEQRAQRRSQHVEGPQHAAGVGCHNQ
eukprot:COSAG01_NODE_6704_length_3536_cov_7.500145_6_plen_210_part_00